ncbi:MAG: class GN sortase [Sphingomonadales bacterium]|nr:class GN sortase [Sphingomonadales bacterium]
MRRTISFGRLPLLLLLLLVGAAGLWQLGDGLKIKAKAALAQILLESAWADTLTEGGPQKPWPWADTWPVAKLIAPAQGEELIVLNGVSGEAMAFGPGLHPDFAAPGHPGTTLIAAHRDTHFRFLEDLAPGDELVLETADGRDHRYAVAALQVLSTPEATLPAGDGGARLVLVTCYPFDAMIAGGPLRYLVFAEKRADPTRLALAHQVE